MATNSFTLAEVKLLCSVLLNNFGIESTINSAGNKSKDQYRIRIPKRELPKLQGLVQPHILSMMAYRVGL